MSYQLPTRPEAARVEGSPAVATANPAARGWLLKLLVEGERAGTPASDTTKRGRGLVTSPPPDSTLSRR
jgi:hypothetical protein